MLFRSQELLIILVIVVLLFGAKKIPELAKGLGTGIKEFKKASTDTTCSSNRCSAEKICSRTKTSVAASNRRPWALIFIFMVLTS